jgi:hypothetical protein
MKYKKATIRDDIKVEYRDIFRRLTFPNLPRILRHMSMSVWVGYIHINRFGFHQGNQKRLVRDGWKVYRRCDSWRGCDDEI